MKNMKKTFGTIRGRILLSTISLIIIISTIIIFISYFVVSSNLQKNLIQTSETKFSFLCSSINSNVDSVKSFIRACQTSSKIKNFALEGNTANNRKKREAHDYMIEVYTSNVSLLPQLIRVVVIGKSRNDIIQVVESSYSTASVSSDAVLSLPYFDTLYANLGEISTGILQDPFIKTKKIPMIPFLHAIYHPYQPGEIGYIYTEMSLSVITEPIHHYSSSTGSRLFFHIGDEQYLYADDDTLLPCNPDYKVLKDLSNAALSNDTTIQKVKFADSDEVSIIITRPLDTNGWYVTEALDISALSRSIFRTFLIIAVIVLAATSMIGIILSLFLSKTVNVPVKQLQERMQRIAGGDFERDPSTEWPHELGDIGKNINDLSENVLLLLNQKIEDERQKKDYEYKMLQSQINPHFLYNTLNSIKWMATIQNAPGIAEMTTSLSRLLKDISKGTTNLVTLDHEIALLNDYFTIQQYRYGGTITLQYHIEDSALTACHILRFTLQPIVENAIFHGIEPKGGTGTIDIYVYQDENTDVHIHITDNGVGIEPEVAAHLLDNDNLAKSSFFRDIGIANVHKRLQYEFGSRYGLSIVSKPDMFTTVCILIPYQTDFSNTDTSKEEHHDEPINSR